MPIIKSAKKRVHVANKATARNRKTKRTIKATVKAFQASLASDKKKATALASEAQSAIDTAVKKGVLHKNKAARKKAQLARDAKAAGVKTAKTTTKPVAAKKTTAKPATKKTPTKTTAKKAPAKKPVSKK